MVKTIMVMTMVMTIMMRATFFIRKHVVKAPEAASQRSARVIQEAASEPEAANSSSAN